METDIAIRHMPYTLFSCIEQVRDACLKGELQFPLTAEGLRQVGMKEWHIFPTKRSLEDIGWFHDGYPTSWFERFVQTYQADHDEYLSMLQTFLQEDLYAEIFTRTAKAQIDLTNASAMQIEPFFSDYEPQKQTRDMAYLFLSLCREAQLIPDLENRPHLSKRKLATKRVEEPVHQHEYQFSFADLMIVRWCIPCGRTWLLTRSAISEPFPKSWQEIKE